MVTIKPRVCAIEQSLVERFKAIQPATVGHLQEFGFCDPGIQTLWKPCSLVGMAVTVRTSALDSGVVHVAIDLADAGDVLVIDRNGDAKHACWGEMTSLAAKRKGLAGAVVDGPATDVVEIAQMGFPVFCRGASAITTKSTGAEGEINTPVQIGGVPVHPGDLIVADSNGVLVLSPAAAASVIEASEAREKREAWVRAELLAGRPLSDISGARARVEGHIHGA
jgi:4-hydroxy-4-methyl-2-oxoglutarate aldolase